MAVLCISTAEPGLEVRRVSNRVAGISGTDRFLAAHELRVSVAESHVPPGILVAFGLVQIDAGRLLGPGLVTRGDQVARAAETVAAGSLALAPPRV